MTSIVVSLYFLRQSGSRFCPAIERFFSVAADCSPCIGIWKFIRFLFAHFPPLHVLFVAFAGGHFSWHGVFVRGGAISYVLADFRNLRCFWLCFRFSRLAQPKLILIFFLRFSLRFFLGCRSFFCLPTISCCCHSMLAGGTMVLCRYHSSVRIFCFSCVLRRMLSLLDIYKYVGYIYIYKYYIIYI